MSEYWIFQDGTHEWCDGDAGVDVPNHEMVVRLHMAYEFNAAVEHDDLLRRFTIEEDRLGDPSAVRELFCDTADALQKEGRLTDEQTDDVYAFLRAATGMSEQRMAVMVDSNDSDARLFAVQHLGGYRVVGRHVETWQLSKSKLRTIGYAMAELLDVADEDMWRTEIVVEDRSNGRRYSVFLQRCVDGHMPSMYDGESVNDWVVR